ncbi:MAG: class I SAM-dependent methyltransferase [Gammaproteobacteria bacterium]|nr:class I SAM-dependent methyltransferase [Gammaproteobacteria bacterium]
MINNTSRALLFTAVLLSLLSPLALAGSAASAQDQIAAAIADPARPDTDRAQDAERKPLAVLTFTGIKPGDRVADFIPGGGYVTRLFSTIVGQHGHVYAVVPEELFGMRKNADAAVAAIAADPHYANVTVIKPAVNAFKAPETLDVVWTSMNYHDLHDSFFGPADLAKVNKAIFDALKPGGLYVIVDHAAAPGSGLRDTETLHRIDAATVKAEVLAAGFELAGQSDALLNADDDHSAKVFDPAIRGKTDKFLFKFRKPVSTK